MKDNPDRIKAERQQEVQGPRGASGSHVEYVAYPVDVLRPRIDEQPAVC